MTARQTSRSVLVFIELCSLLIHGGGATRVAFSFLRCGVVSTVGASIRCYSADAGKVQKRTENALIDTFQATDIAMH